MKRCGQTNTNASQLAAKYRNLRETKTTPLSNSSGSGEFEIVPAAIGAFQIEMLLN